MSYIISNNPILHRTLIRNKCAFNFSAQAEILLLLLPVIKRALGKYNCSFYLYWT